MAVLRHNKNKILILYLAINGDFYCLFFSFILNYYFIVGGTGQWTRHAVRFLAGSLHAVVQQPQELRHPNDPYIARDAIPAAHGQPRSKEVVRRSEHGF